MEWPFVEPITRHVPIGLGRDGFLDRCLDLDKLAIEALAERHLRPLVRRIAAPEDNIDGFRGLKLLDRLACLAQVANGAGLDLSRAGGEVIARYHRDGTNPPRPLDRLFAISDLRQLKGHRKDVEARIVDTLGRFGVDPGNAAAGWGGILDIDYDAAVEELNSLETTLDQALATSR